MKYNITIDPKILEDAVGELNKKIKTVANEAMASLAISTHAKALELATENLTVTRDIYAQALSFDQLSDNMWVVSLDMKQAGWIEDGRKSGFMEELLRGKSAKVAKDGSRYAVIPFEHSKAPSRQTPSAQRMTQEIKDFLKKRKIDYKKIEHNPDGTPKLGLLHSFKKGIGTNIYPSNAAKNEFSKGLSIYQTMNKKGKVSRDVMTFRIISEKHRSEGLWNHPGRKGVFIIDKAYEWAMRELQDNVMPEILKKLKEEA